jgi:hypothetical protein
MPVSKLSMRAGLTARNTGRNCSLMTVAEATCRLAFAFCFRRRSSGEERVCPREGGEQCSARSPLRARRALKWGLVSQGVNWAAAAKPRIWKSAGRAQSRSDGISPSMAVAGTFKAPAGSEQAGASTSQASYFLTGDQVVVELSYL